MKTTYAKITMLGILTLFTMTAKASQISDFCHRAETWQARVKSSNPEIIMHIGAASAKAHGLCENFSSELGTDGLENNKVQLAAIYEQLNNRTQAAIEDLQSALIIAANGGLVRAGGALENCYQEALLFQSQILTAETVLVLIR